MKQYLDQINGIAEKIYNELYKRVDATPNKFVDLQNLDCTKDNIYGVPEEDATPTNIIGLAIFDGVLCAYFEPQFTGKKTVYTADEMLEGDFWVMIDPKSDNFVANMMNIAECIDQYLPKL